MLHVQGQAPGSNSVQGGRDGKPPGKPANAYAGAMSIDFTRVSELEESADGVASLDKIGCSSLAVNYYGMSDEEIIEDVLRDSPGIAEDMYTMAVFQELVDGQAAFKYSDLDNDDPIRFVIFPATRVALGYDMICTILIIR
jgi:hypothetical protein